MFTTLGNNAKTTYNWVSVMIAKICGYEQVNKIRIQKTGPGFMKQSSANPTSNWHQFDVGLALDCFMKPGPADFVA